MHDEKKFLDLKVKAFHNKKNGQISITLPKKKLKGLFRDDVPNSKNIPIRLYKWGKK